MPNLHNKFAGSVNPHTQTIENRTQFIADAFEAIHITISVKYIIISILLSNNPAERTSKILLAVL